MIENKIFNSVVEAIQDVLDEPDLEITMESDHESIEGWDSMCQVRIVLALESEFGVQFTADEISEMTSVKLLVDNLEKAV